MKYVATRFGDEKSLEMFLNASNMKRENIVHISHSHYKVGIDYYDCILLVYMED